MRVASFYQKQLRFDRFKATSSELSPVTKTDAKIIPESNRFRAALPDISTAFHSI